MADNEKVEETTPRANDWEVVSLTASTYAAAPGPTQVQMINKETNTVEKDEAETLKAMVMSGHFAYPQKEPEKLQLEPESVEVSGIDESKDLISSVSADNGGIAEKKDDNNWNEIQAFNEKESSLSFDDVKFIADTNFEGLDLIERELSLHKSERTLPEEEIVDHELVESAEGGFDSDSSHLSISAKKDENTEGWWKKHAASLYAQAKEANAFWSIFVAATVMGLVILGQHWQLERWQVVQLRWQVNLKNEKMGWMLSPLARFKDVLVGGNRGSGFTRSNSLADN